MLADKVILITGGCGSFGQAFVKEVLKEKCKAMRIFDHNEGGIQNMKSHFQDKRLRFFIGDVRDKERLKLAMSGVNIVVHAAALKHVDLCEYNPEEAFKTNIDGSRNVALVSLSQGIEKAIAISSDKAVHPISTYGATKLGMEKIFTRYNVYGNTKFCCIRSGNFEGSSGSLIEIVARQLDNGEPITITDKDMTRYWIDSERVAQFTLQCLEVMKGGEIFIPKMSQKSVMELVKTIAPDAEIKIIGKRIGEKLSEMLFGEGERPEDCGDYFVVRVGDYGGS